MQGSRFEKLTYRYSGREFLLTDVAVVAATKYSAKRSQRSALAAVAQAELFFQVVLDSMNGAFALRNG